MPHSLDTLRQQRLALTSRRCRRRAKAARDHLAAPGAPGRRRSDRDCSRRARRAARARAEADGTPTTGDAALRPVEPAQRCARARGRAARARRHARASTSRNARGIDQPAEMRFAPLDAADDGSARRGTRSRMQRREHVAEPRELSPRRAGRSRGTAASAPPSRAPISASGPRRRTKGKASPARRRRACSRAQCALRRTSRARAHIGVVIAGHDGDVAPGRRAPASQARAGANSRRQRQG